MRSIVIIACLMATFEAPAVAQQACPTLTITTNDDAVNGDTSSPCALIASPGGDGISLREALLAANNATGTGVITITFSGALAGATIALTSRFAPITRDQITISGPTNNGQPTITLDATNAANPGAIFFVAASDFTMSGLNVTNLPASFNSMQVGGSSFSLQGQPISSPQHMSGVVISGNIFSNGTNANTFGIFLPDSIGVSSGTTISDVVISGNIFTRLFEGVNIQAAGTNNVIENITIFNNGFSQMTSTGTSAVEVGGTTGSNNEISSVQIVQNTFTGNFQGVVIDINGATSGTTVDSTVIARNVFSGNLGAMAVVAGVNSNSTNNVVSNTQIVDNLVDLTGYNGQGAATIQIIDNQSGTNNKVTGVSFVNNTINNGSSASPPGWGVWVTSSGGVTGVNIWNSIFWGNESSPPLNGVTSAEVSYSIVDQSGFSGANHNINSDPLFVNSGGGNFGLQSGSPALHAGITGGAPAIDLDCQPRGSPPSIGAYEFDGPNICPSTYSAPLTATPTSGTPPLAVSFTASGLALPMTYTINFGDGTTGALTQSSCIGVTAIVGGRGGIQCSGSASHTYTAAGSYSATLLNALGLTVGTVAITVTGAAPKVSIVPPNKATTLGSQTIPALQDVARQTLEAPFAGSNATEVQPTEISQPKATTVPPSLPSSFSMSPPMSASTTPPVPSSNVQPDKLIVTRTNPNVPSFKKTITDRAQVQKMYQEIMNLPVFHQSCNEPSGCNLNCPLVTGVGYRLDFSSDTVSLLSADYHPTGCGYLRLSDGTERIESAEFEINFEQARGISSDRE